MDVLMCISMVVSIMYMKAVNERASLISFQIDFMGYIYAIVHNYKAIFTKTDIMQMLEKL